MHLVECRAPPSVSPSPKQIGVEFQSMVLPAPYSQMPIQMKKMGIYESCIVPNFSGLEPYWVWIQSAEAQLQYENTLSMDVSFF